MVEHARLTHLTRGINLSHWFAQAELTPTHFHGYITPDDLSEIEALGFRHVRLNLDPEIVSQARHPSEQDTRNLRYLDAALDMILANRLAVVLDLHPDAKFKRRVEVERGFAASVATYWGRLARHISTLDPERVFLEVMSEPLVSKPAKWARLQTEIVAAMRAGAPFHTLVATGHEWSSVDDLLQLDPLDDANVMYNFHFYEPLAFTHQGAMYGDRESWDRGKLEDRIAQAAAWAKRHRVSLTCNEFGVHRRLSSSLARVTWLYDVRSLLEQFHIGWTMWDYAGEFGLMVEQAGQRTLDLPTLSVLGLG